MIPRCQRRLVRRMGSPRKEIPCLWRRSVILNLMVWASAMERIGRGGEREVHSEVFPFPILSIEPRPLATRWPPRHNVLLHLSICHSFPASTTNSMYLYRLSLQRETSSLSSYRVNRRRSVISDSSHISNLSKIRIPRNIFSQSCRKSLS